MGRLAMLVGLACLLLGAVVTGWLETRVTAFLLTQVEDRATRDLDLRALAGPGIVHVSVVGRDGGPVSDPLLERALQGSAASLLEDPELNSRPSLAIYRPIVVDGQIQGAYRADLDAAPIQVGRQLARLALAVSLTGLLVLCRRGREQQPNNPPPNPTPAVVVVGGWPAPPVEPPRPSKTVVAEVPRPPPAPAGLPVPPPAAHGLTARELEGLRLMATSSTYREIATQLVVGEETIRTHAKNILHKLQQPDRRKAVLAAAALGLL